jgi:hypothetical protein
VLDPQLFQVAPPGRRASALDDTFIPLSQAEVDWPAPSLAALEAAVGKASSSAMIGAVCWRFTEATGINGAALLSAVQARASQDLCLCNPTPELEGAYANLWMQGNTVHPRLLEAAVAFFKANKWDPVALTEVQPSRVFSSSQYLIGRKTFWSAYLPFVHDALDRALSKIPRRTAKWMAEPVTDPRDPQHPITYWPLIIERLIPVFLKGPGAALKVARLPSVLGEKRLNGHLRRLREMKDVAHQSKSAWLIGCWMHYRNSYLMNVIDRNWCTQHLPALTSETHEFY